MKNIFVFNNIRLFSSNCIVPKICIVGAGPAGFYAAQRLLKILKNVTIDILEKLPVPFGLVRFGVAPDHPKVKNVINTFHKTATNPCVQFIGNVDVGRDVTINQLQEMYHAVLLTYGAPEDALLKIPGENLNNVISGRHFVGWYNGVPANKNLDINLDMEEAVILGQGNVAIDIARILLTSVDNLKNTDITSFALEQLSKSKVRKIQLIGRRGPLQAAFAISELREFSKLEKCKIIWRPDDFIGIREIVPKLPKSKKRLVELMLKFVEDMPLNKQTCTTNINELHPIFLRSPIEFLGCATVNGIKLAINDLEGNDIINKIAKATDKIEEIPCSLAFRSIGYRSMQIDSSIPFDPKYGRIINNAGKVEGNLYAAGWAATGPLGAIVNTMTNAFHVSELICTELILKENKIGTDGLRDILNKKNICTVSYSDWEKIDLVERERGKKVGKPREKIVDVMEMFNIISK